MGDVVSLGFPELLWRSGVRLDHRSEFEADPVAWVWRGIDPDLQEARAWLDGNAPGWTTRIGELDFEQLEPPIGRDEVASFLTFDVHAVFRSAAHRDAWRARRSRLEAEAARLRALVAERVASAPAGSRICRACGEQMDEITRSETARVAQFAFAYSFPATSCKGCGAFAFRATDLSAVSDATGMATSRVGLPDHDSPLWNEDHGAEWRRRREAEPEIEIAVGPGMSADAIMALLDTELLRRGRAVGGRPRSA